jgi:DNA-binding MarR family transcriptional regulator
MAWLHTNRAAMNPSLELLRAVAAVSHERQAALAEQGIREGRWTAEHVAAYHCLPDSEPAPRERKSRAPTVTRRMRLSRRRCSFSRYVRRFSTDVLTHPFLSTGAITTLAYLISRCGRGRQHTTCTSWLAADLGVTSRTIQKHFRLLEQAGFLVRSAPDRRGRTTLYLTELVEVGPLQRNKAETVAQLGDGAKEVSDTDDTDSKKEGDAQFSQKESKRGASSPPTSAAPSTRGRCQRLEARIQRQEGSDCRREIDGSVEPPGSMAAFGGRSGWWSSLHPT